MKPIMSFLFYGAIALVIFFLLYSLAGAVIELVSGYVAYQIGGSKDE